MASVGLPTEPQDVISAVIAYLKARAEISALVGTNVFGGQLPKSAADLKPSSALVVQPFGGLRSQGQSYLPTRTPRVALLSYASDFATAHELALKAQTALLDIKGHRQGTTLIKWCEVSGDIIQDVDEQINWPVMVQSLTIFHDIREAA